MNRLNPVRDIWIFQIATDWTLTVERGVWEDNTPHFCGYPVSLNATPWVFPGTVTSPCKCRVKAYRHTICQNLHRKNVFTHITLPEIFELDWTVVRIVINAKPLGKALIFSV